MRNRKRDAVDINPFQHVLHRSHNRERNVTAHVGPEQQPESHYDVFGKPKVGFQSGIELVHAQLDATEVWKGNRGVDVNWVLIDTGVTGEEGFQSRAAAERVQDGS